VITERDARASLHAKMLLSPALGPDDFLLAPHGRYVIADRWLAFYRAGLSGLVLWGDQTGADIASALAVAPSRFATPVPPHRTVLDVRSVRSVDADVVGAFRRLFAQPTLYGFIARGAVLHPGGTLELMVAGMQAICAPRFPAALFADLREAAVWLGGDDAMPLFEEVDRLRIVATEALLGRLSRLLEARYRLTLREAARSLGVSSRSLQRVLAANRTSFQDQRTLATVRNAQRLLLGPDADVTSVAYAVGCASSQHLGKLFSRVVGEPPSRWRARQRVVH